MDCVERNQNTLPKIGLIVGELCICLHKHAQTAKRAETDNITEVYSTMEKSALEDHKRYSEMFFENCKRSITL